MGFYRLYINITIDKTMLIHDIKTIEKVTNKFCLYYVFIVHLLFVHRLSFCFKLTEKQLKISSAYHKKYRIEESSTMRANIEFKYWLAAAEGFLCKISSVGFILESSFSLRTGLSVGSLSSSSN